MCHMNIWTKRLVLFCQINPPYLSAYKTMEVKSVISIYYYSKFEVIFENADF